MENAPSMPPSTDNGSVNPIGDEQNKPSSSWLKSKKLWLGIAAALVLVSGAILGIMQLSGDKAENQPDKAAQTTSSQKVKLTYAVHWLEDYQINGVKKDGKLVNKGLKQYLDEYTATHQNVTFDIMQVPYGEYANKLTVLNESGAAPDIYQIYSPWGVSYVRDDMLAEPPADIKKDVEKNYISSAGATIDGKLWGIPTEINNYALLYNKELFKQAGITTPPKTWADLQAAAAKLTKRNAQGTITQYGIAFLRDNDWQVVDPFLSLLFSSNGEFLSEDLKKSLVNSPEGVEALDSLLQLFRNKSTDASGNFYDFKDGKVGMVISPPWPKSTFAQSYGSAFEEKVGVVPVPYLEKQTTLQYSWFAGVMKDSPYQKEAWDFLQWFTAEVQPETKTTRYGDLLANTIGAIPARKDDFDRHKDVLGDFYTSVYVSQMKNSKAEPNVLQSGAIKALLMAEIQAAWDGKKTSKQALDDATTAIDKILKQYY